MNLKAKSLIIISIFSALSFHAIAQGSMQEPSCQDPIIHSRVVINNNTYEEKGYTINTTKNVMMPNGGYYAVPFKVKKGKQYVVSYYPQGDAKKVQMIIGDEHKKEIYKAKGATGQQLSHSFISAYDGQMIIFLRQKIKKSKVVCGGISVMEK